MRNRLPLLLGVLALTPALASAQTAPVEGLRDNTPTLHALTSARVVVAPGRVLENATVVVRNGVVEAVGANVSAPAGARVWDLSGRTIYPGFIDAYSDVGMPEKPVDGDVRRTAHWNPQVRSWFSAGAEFDPAERRSAELRAQGFTVAQAVPKLGLFRGETAAVSLGAGALPDRVIRPGIAQAVALWRDAEVGQTYPTSDMGAIAFIRQTLHDADWHTRAHTAFASNPNGARRPESNAALGSLSAAVRGQQQLLFETRHEEDILRVMRFRDEFPLSIWVRGSGSEYRIADALAGLRTPLILPLAYPDTPDVRRPEAALDVSLADLRHWYLAPENPGRLTAAGVEYALTSDGLRRRADFLPNLRRAVQRGLAPDVALASLTTVPARYLGIERTHGTIEAGKSANLIVASGDLFAGAPIEDVWVDGRRFEIERRTAAEPRGEWALAWSGSPTLDGRLSITGPLTRLSGSLHANGQEVRLSTATRSGSRG